MNVTRGRIREAQRCVIHGPAGVGKSSLAALLPGAVVIDTEGSTSDLDVTRLPRPGSWAALMQTVGEFYRDPMGFNVLVIDTADWAEALAIPHVCAAHGLAALSGQGDYGHSFNLLATEWGRFLDGLTAITTKGVHVVLLAHTTVKKREVPEEFGAFDKWLLKMEKKTSEKTIEWARNVLFLNTKVLVVEDSKTKTKKGTSPGRFLYSQQHPCWEAKCREPEFPDEIEVQRGVLPAPLAALFAPLAPVAAQAPVTAPAPASAPAPAPAIPCGSTAQAQLAELMKASGITEQELMMAIAERGHFPANTPLRNLPGEYIGGALMPHWSRVVESIKKDTTHA